MTARGVEFDAKNVVGDFANLREMYTRSGSRTVPVIIIGDEVLIGYDPKRLDAVLTEHGL